MLLNRNLVNIRVGLFGFITLGIYTPLEARVYCSHTFIERPRIWATYLEIRSLIYQSLPVVFA